ncbi:MAG TPA: hypothetical protein DER09_08575 [Prolixibacteraceae bacterium]|nr:hypothetical protein [Prolixibacteraceae bacterium]
MGIQKNQLWQVKLFTTVPPYVGNNQCNKMIKTVKLNIVSTMVIAILALITIAGCEKDDEFGSETSYNLEVQDVLGVTGTATIIETGSNSVNIDLVLFGAPSGTHPAELCMNTVAEGGSVVVTLNPVDDTGKSSTKVTSMSYSQLIAYDGFIKVMKSTAEPLVILAQGDIGGNVITETNKTYNLDTIGAYGVSGTALFEKRENGNSLLTISLTGTIAGEVYPATINLSSISTIGGGPVTKTLSSVNGATGKSYTTLRKLNNGLNITYDNWLVYDGYINIYQTSVDFVNIISHGNIGSN